MENIKNVYLDNAATTEVHPAVWAAMNDAEARLFYNSSTLYSGGIAAAAEIAKAKEIVKNRLHGSSGELHFMSGATEANNTVIFGRIQKPNHHLVVTAGEHSSVYAPAATLASRGFNVDHAPLTPSGEIDIAHLSDLITPQTALFVFGLVNSDTGTLQDAAKVIAAVRTKNPRVHIHCDAAQAFCKFDFDVQKMGADSVTISAHKINGPKGMGALWLRRGLTLPPLMFGGDHGLRPGTENNSAAIGFGKAAEVWDTRKNYEHAAGLHKRLIAGLPAGCRVNGINNNPFITNIALPKIYGETVLNALNAKNIFVGLGSACAAGSAGSRTLQAMGVPFGQQKQVLRVSLGTCNTAADIDAFLKELKLILGSY